MVYWKSELMNVENLYEIQLIGKLCDMCGKENTVWSKVVLVVHEHPCY